MGMTYKEKLIVAIERAKEQSEEYGLDRILVDFKAADMILELLKERQGKGHWVEYPECLEYDGAIDDTDIACSECGHVFSVLNNCTEEFDFCPHCGADMRGTSDGEGR